MWGFGYGPDKKVKYHPARCTFCSKQKAIGKQTCGRSGCESQLRSQQRRNMRLQFGSKGRWMNDAYRVACDHGVYINGTLKPACPSCDKRVTAISSNEVGDILWTYCRNCNDHWAWCAFESFRITVDPMPFWKRLLYLFRPRKLYYELARTVSANRIDRERRELEA